ncbi:hypothetical protein S40293_02246 [Stachybotrys chartarum IBT 40293]|nr:hypothetical protein S40293_02246 [Stachybotrys chartarum IBT 40293]
MQFRSTYPLPFLQIYQTRSTWLVAGMPPLAGFTGNPFRNRDDLVRAAHALILPLSKYRSSSGARVKIRPATGAAFNDAAAQFQDFAQPLFAIGAFLHHDSSGSDHGSQLENFFRGLEAGVNPSSPEYWGDLIDLDPRMVEMESISLALLAVPDQVLLFLSDIGKENLVSWLQQINFRQMPPNHWRWSRILVNLAIEKVFAIPQSETVVSDLALLDSFHVCEGWSSDRPYEDNRKQAGCHPGSLAIQFSQLLYAHFSVGDEERAERYKQQARQFAATYWRYFDTNGAAIPFGESPDRRFALAEFWAAASVAGVDLPDPVSRPGHVKGLLLRHLRWWSKYEDIFASDGTLNLGFTYPSMHLADAGHSPQSFYSCLRSFIILLLPADDAFWLCQELDHPLAVTSNDLPAVKMISSPGHLLCNSPEHHYLLSAGHGTTEARIAREAKYGKFAYSSAFGFSVPTGPSLSQMAPDSTLCASVDGETWVARCSPTEIRTEVLALRTDGQTEEVMYSALTSVWTPWDWLDIRVETYLIPLADHRPGWHLRIHRIAWSPSALDTKVAEQVEFFDAGFAISPLTAEGHRVSAASSALGEGGYFLAPGSTFIESAAGASGMVNLTSSFLKSVAEDPDKEVVAAVSTTVASILYADPNTNLIAPKTLIPIIKHTVLKASVSTLPDNPEIGSTAPYIESWLVTGVFAVSTANGPRCDIGDLWHKQLRIKSLRAISSKSFKCL